MTVNTLRSLLSEPSSFPSNPSPQSISHSISTVRSAISRWDPQTSLSPSFLQATTHLHSHLLHLSTSASGASRSSSQSEIIKIHTLLESAMQRVEEMLKRHLFSIPAVDLVSDKIATIRSIVQTMLSTGYGEECVSTYQSIRQSNFNSQMVRFGFDQSANQTKIMRKLKWEMLDRRIKSWTDIAPVVVRSLCSDEQQLCDGIFATSTEPVRDLIFSGIAGDTALKFLSFPETVAVNLKPSPEKLFRLLDMYVILSDLLPDIESIFGSEPTSAVRSQAASSLAKLSQVIRTVISELEIAIQKDPLKLSGVPGGAIHPLTRYVMNYLAYLSDFELSLHEILIDLPPNCDSSFFELYNLEDGSVVSARIAWVLFMLLCKIDSKADTYSDVAVSYLFLANNLHYIVRKVQSCSLKEILGDEWVSEHAKKACRFMEGHVRSGWAHVSGKLPVNISGEEDIESLREFELAFQKVMKDGEGWVIVDEAMREEVRLMVEAMVVPMYRGLYQTCNDFVHLQFLPEDVKTMILRFY